MNDDIDSKNLEKVIALAKISESNGYSSSALELYKLALTIAPEKESTVYRIAKNLLEIGRISDAESFLKRLKWNAAPKPWLIEIALGELRLAQFKPVEAEQHFRTACSMNPHSTVPAVLFSNCLFKQERFLEAKRVLTEALSARGDIEEVYLNLGLVERAMGNYPNARDCFLKALEIDPQYPSAKHALADVDSWLNFIKH